MTSRRKTTTLWVDGRDGKYPWPWSKVLPIGLLGGAAVIGLSTALVVPSIEDDLTAETLAELDRAGIDPSLVDVDFSYRSGVVRVPQGVDPDAVVDAVSFGGIRSLEVVRNPGSEATTSPSSTTTAPPPSSTTAGPATTGATSTSVPAASPPASPAQSVPTPVRSPTQGPAEVRAEWAGGLLHLTGTVASEEQRAQLVAAATAAVGAAAVEDALIVEGPPAPALTDAQVAELGSLLATAPTLTNASYLLIGDLLTVTGNAPSEAVAAAVKAATGTLVEVSGTATIAVSAAPSATLNDLRAALAALAPQFADTVVFTTSSIALDPPALESLDKVVALLRQHPGPVITVVGHTDNHGGRAANQRLSEARAGAVVEYLVGRGVDPARVRSRGVGETAPVARNSTPEGRDRNRRVELVAADPS